MKDAEVCPMIVPSVSPKGCAVPQSGEKRLVGPGRTPGHAAPQSGEERLVGPRPRARLTNVDLYRPVPTMDPRAGKGLANV